MRAKEAILAQEAADRSFSAKNGSDQDNAVGPLFQEELGHASSSSNEERAVCPYRLVLVEDGSSQRPPNSPPDQEVSPNNSAVTRIQCRLSWKK